MAYNKNKADKKIIDLDREMNKLVSNIERKVEEGTKERMFQEEEWGPIQASTLFFNLQGINTQTINSYFKSFNVDKNIYFIDKNGIYGNINELSKKSPKEINLILNNIMLKEKILEENEAKTLGIKHRICEFHEYTFHFYSKSRRD